MNKFLSKTKNNTCSLLGKLKISGAIIIAFLLFAIRFYSTATKFYFSTEYNFMWIIQLLIDVGFMTILAFFYQLTLAYKLNQLIKSCKTKKE